MKKYTFLMLLVLSLIVVACAPGQAPDADQMDDTAEEVVDEVEEVPEVPEPQEDTMEEPVNDTVDEPDTPSEQNLSDETEEAVDSEGETHVIEATDSGFDPDEITINVGDTVLWRNVREVDGGTDYAWVYGSLGPCRRPVLDSGYPPGLDEGEEYSFTFNESMVGECKYVDGIRTQQTGRIIVEE